MDGNGRWAQARGAAARGRPQARALEPVRIAIEECAQRGIEALTLFAFSSENWQRPPDEVASLMELFVDALDREIAELHANGVRVRFIGDRRALSRAPAERGSPRRSSRTAGNARPASCRSP